MPPILWLKAADRALSVFCCRIGIGRPRGLNTAKVRSVLIVGGGIAGLTLAAALHQRGLKAEVVERNPEWVAEGAGISVQPNGMRVLRRLGLDRAVIDAGIVLTRWVFASHHGDVISEIDLNSVWIDVGPFIGIARSRLQDVLVEGISEVPFRLGTSVTSITQGSGEARVRFTDGSSQVYDLVIGADGISSTVRELGLDKVVPTYSGQIVWRSLAPIDLSGAPSIQFWLGEGRFFLLASVGPHLTYGAGNITQERQYDPVEGRLQRLRQRFGDFGAAVQDFLAHLHADEQIHCSAIEWVEQRTWHNERVLLIGDAAHATSPFMGQGGSLAMEDALVLAEVLDEEPTVEDAILAYGHRRAPRINWVQEQSRAVAESFQLPPVIRDGVLRTRGAKMFEERYAPLRENP